MRKRIDDTNNPNNINKDVQESDCNNKNRREEASPMLSSTFTLHLPSVAFGIVIGIMFGVAIGIRLHGDTLKWLLLGDSGKPQYRSSYSSSSIRDDGHFQEIALFHVGENMIDQEPAAVVDFPMHSKNSNQWFQKSSAALGERIVSLVDNTGVPLTKLSHVPNKLFALRQGDLFMFPTEKVGSKVQVYLPQASRSVTVETVSTTPRVFRVDNFLDPDECKQIIADAKSRMAPSSMRVVGKKDPTTIQHQDRTSTTAWISKSTPEFAKIKQRVEDLIKIPSEHFEDLQVVRYQRGQHYYAHHDYFDPADYEDEIMARTYRSVNRMVTVLFYLADGFEGGETYFPYSGNLKPITSPKELENCSRGLKVAPKMGTAVVFYGMTPRGHRNGELDPFSLHGGCDVTSESGEKWISNFWVANQPIGAYQPARMRRRQLQQEKGQVK